MLKSTTKILWALSAILILPPLWWLIWMVGNIFGIISYRTDIANSKALLAFGLSYLAFYLGERMRTYHNGLSMIWPTFILKLFFVIGFLQILPFIILVGLYMLILM